MGHSTEVLFRNHFVFLSDPQMAAVLFAAEKVARRVFPEDCPAWNWLKSALKTWEESVRCSGNGLINPQFDEILIDQQSVDEMILLLKNTRQYFESFGTVVPWFKADEDIFRGLFPAIVDTPQPVSTKGFIDAVDHLIALLAVNSEGVGDIELHKKNVFRRLKRS